jgi:hypothetical protein
VTEVPDPVRPSVRGALAGVGFVGWLRWRKAKLQLTHHHDLEAVIETVEDDRQSISEHGSRVIRRRILLVHASPWGRVRLLCRSRNDEHYFQGVEMVWGQESIPKLGSRRCPECLLLAPLPGSDADPNADCGGVVDQ